MKKTIITIVLAIFATICASAQERTRIDFDYRKMFNVDILWLDTNLNGKADDDEISKTTGGCFAAFDYRDFDTAGSTLRLEAVLQNENKKLELVGMIDDAILYLKKDEKETSYTAYNKLGETQFIILKEDGQTYLLVVNPVILKIK